MIDSSIDWYSLGKVIITVIIIWTAVTLNRFVRRRPYNLPPGPRRLPIMGQLSFFDHLTVFDHKDKYGDVSYLKVFGKDVIILNSIESIRKALTDADRAENFSHRPDTKVQKLLSNFDIIYKSISSDWKRLKHTAHNLLKQHSKGVEKLEGVISTELEYVTDLLHDNIKQSVDIMDYIKPFTANVIFTLLIGERYNYQHPLIANVESYIKRGEHLSKPFVNAIVHMFPIIRFSPVGIGRTLKEVFALRDEILNQLLEKQKQLPTADIQTREGMVFDLIRLQQTEKWLDDSKIGGVVENMIAAGVATTSATLYAFFAIILRFPEIQTNIQSEIDKHIVQDRRPRLSDRQNMPYTQAVILELLRYSPILPFSVPHSSVSNDELYGYTIPGGSTVLPNLFRVHHDEKLWENAWTFDPHRFLDQSGQVIPPGHPIRRNIIPFGIGKRACMGEVLAKTRIFLFIVYLLQRFTFVPDEESPTPSCDPRDYMRKFIPHPFPYKLVVQNRE